MLRAALQNGEEGLAGRRLINSEPADTFDSSNMFADLVPSSPTYVAPTYSKTPVAPVMNPIPVTQPYNTGVVGPAQGGSYVPAPVTSGAADWNLYLQNNPDVLANYNNVNHSQFPTAASYAQWHYQHYGMTEGRAYPTPRPVQPTPQPAPQPQPTPTPATPAPTTPTTPVVTSPTPATPATPTSTNPGLPENVPYSQLTDIIRSTPGYQFQLAQGLNAINSNAYARGMGNSGATLKALSDYGQKTADSYYQQYLNNVAQVAGGGASAAGALAGVGQQYGHDANGVSQNLADAIGTGALRQGTNTANMWGSIAGNIQGAVGGLGRTGMFGSSIG